MPVYADPERMEGLRRCSLPMEWFTDDWGSTRLRCCRKHQAGKIKQRAIVRAKEHAERKASAAAVAVAGVAVVQTRLRQAGCSNVGPALKETSAVHTIVVIPSALSTLPGQPKERLGGTAGGIGTGNGAVAVDYGGAHIHKLLYSDHSSFDEIVAFIQMLQPGKRCTAFYYITAAGLAFTKRLS